MSVYNTSFCFVCSHLASGEKEGDELKRNADVAEILKSTQFPKICKGPNPRTAPERIIDHEYVYLHICVCVKLFTLSIPFNNLFFLFILILFGYVRICSRVIWLGDLNYRVALSYEKTRLLLEDNDWDSLLEKDQVIGFVMRTNLNK